MAIVTQPSGGNIGGIIKPASSTVFWTLLSVQLAAVAHFRLFHVLTTGGNFLWHDIVHGSRKEKPNTETTSPVIHGAAVLCIVLQHGLARLVFWWPAAGLFRGLLL